MQERAKIFQALELVDYKRKDKLNAAPSSMEDVLNKWHHCSACPLGSTRLNLVPGAGSLKAKVMFVGEAPGEQEDKQGLPFVGRAGRLLTALLSAIHLTREEVYITNVLKCRPPNNRDPLPLEVAQCKPFLLEQLRIIQPKLIVTLGRIASQLLLETTSDMKTLRGTWHTHAPSNTPLLVTYHPAYLLRAPAEKAKAYQDFLLIKHRLRTLG